MEKSYSALNIALEQLRIAAEKLELDPGLHEMLKYPKRTLIVSVNIKMDNGAIKTFLGMPCST